MAAHLHATEPSRPSYTRQEPPIRWRKDPALCLCPLLLCSACPAAVCEIRMSCTRGCMCANVWWTQEITCRTPKRRHTSGSTFFIFNFFLHFLFLSAFFLFIFFCSSFCFCSSLQRWRHKKVGCISLSSGSVGPPPPRPSRGEVPREVVSDVLACHMPRPPSHAVTCHSGSKTATGARARTILQEFFLARSRPTWEG